MEKVCSHLRARHARGQNHALVVCSEGVRLASGGTVSHAFADGEVRYGGVGAAIADIIARETGAETRVTVLGHVQRGGSPCAFDKDFRELARHLCRRSGRQGQDQPLRCLEGRQGVGRAAECRGRQDARVEARRDDGADGAARRRLPRRLSVRPLGRPPPPQALRSSLAGRQGARVILRLTACRASLLPSPATRAGNSRKCLPFAHPDSHHRLSTCREGRAREDRS